MAANAQVLYAHIAENAFPSEGGKLNLIGIFAGLNNPGTIGVQQFPTMYPRLALAVGLSTTKDKLPISVTFKDEDGNDITPAFTGTFEIDRTNGPAKNEAANINFNLNFDAFQIKQAGKIFLTIESGKDELAELELSVVEGQPQQPPQR